VKARSLRPRAAPVRSELDEGLVHHRAGRVAEAEACYRAVWRRVPGHPDAGHLIGLCRLAAGDWRAAQDWIGRAVAARPRAAEYRVSLGSAHLAAGDTTAAIAAYERAIALGDSPAARSNLGHALRLVGRLDDAELHLHRALERDPALVDGLINLALVRLDRDDVGGANQLLDRAVARDPTSAAAWLNRGVARKASGDLEGAALAFGEAASRSASSALAFRNLGLTLQLLGRLDEAVEAYRRALAQDSGDADALTNLGLALMECGDLDAAVEAQSSAVAAAPALAAAWLNRGSALQAVGRLDEARASIERALAIGDEPAKGWTALGAVEAELGSWERAVACHERALEQDADFPDAHWNLALALLASGRLARGWQEYEWRWRATTRSGPRRSYPWPLWEGQPLRDRRLLVWREQGLGDELLFLTCVGDLVAAGADLTLVVSARLVTLVARAFPGVRVVGDGPEALAAGAGFDWQVPLGSLPRWVRGSRAAFPATGGAYLVPAADQVAKWRTRLAALGPGGRGRRVGVCWRSGLATAARQRHYAPLGAWGALWRVPGVEWVSLQYDECGAEVEAVAAAHGVRLHRWAGEDLRDDLESVVGLVAALDAVVVAPTAVSSVAGAVGVRGWQVDSGSDWTALGEAVSPWWPTLGVERRAAGEPWEAVLARVAGALGAWAAA
jgi:tetratricopeptide (TPR) repeat protein